MTAVILNLDKVNLSDEQSYRLCQVNQNWQLERRLINPQYQQVEIYRPGQPVEVIRLPNTLGRETILPDFFLPLSRL